MDKSANSIDTQLRVEETNRLVFVDIMKALCIMLVILGHADFANAPIKSWIYSFHMPVFFLITGMTFNMNCSRTQEATYAFVYKKFKSLMIPFILWGVIYSALSIGNIVRIAYGSHWSLIQAGSLSSLWFLPVMFLAVCLLRFVCCKMGAIRETYCARIIMAIVVIAFSYLIPDFKYGYPWGMNIAFCACGFIVLGSVFRSLYGGISKNNHSVCIYVIFAVAGGFGTFLYKFNIPDSGYINMAESVYGNILIFLIVALSGGMFILNISVLLEKNKALSKLFSYIGRNSLIIFLIHRFILNLFGRFFEIIKLNQSIELIVALIGTVAVSCLAGAIIEKFAPVLCGK